MIPKFLPKKLCIIGSGAIGIEFASIYNALGSDVTVFESQNKILPQFDNDISNEAKKIFEKKGIKFELNSKIEKIVEDNKNVSFNNIDQKVVCDALILSVGVIPNIDKDFISSLNLNLSDTGYINTNHNYETNIKGLYAIVILLVPHG